MKPSGLKTRSVPHGLRPCSGERGYFCSPEHGIDYLYNMLHILCISGVNAYDMLHNSMFSHLKKVFAS